MTATAFLSDEEIAGICAPLQQPAAQVRYLEGLGLTVRRKPNGRPLVARANFDRVMTGAEAAAAIQQPAGHANVIALRQRWANRNNKNGPTTRR